MDRQHRNAWIKTMHQWHWVSAAISLAGVFLFAITGITLNHAGQIEAKAQVQSQTFMLPAEMLNILLAAQKEGSKQLPTATAAWISSQLNKKIASRQAEWSDGEVYLALPKPGGDAWLSIDLSSGMLEYEQTDRGWIAYLNDLHKGRQTGAVWSAFIDVVAFACVVFSITGLVLLQVHAKRRPTTWPIVIVGFLIPFLFAMFLFH